MSQKSCSSCAYCGEVKAPDVMGPVRQTVINVCRRNPPTPLVNSVGTASAFWPTVKPDDWCGEWADKNPAPANVEKAAKSAKPPKAVA